jgi:hypothetical protein
MLIRRKLPSYMTQVNELHTRVMRDAVMEKVEELHWLQLALDENEQYSSFQDVLRMKMSHITSITNMPFYNDIGELGVYEALRAGAVDIERTVFDFMDGRDANTMRHSMPGWRWELYEDIVHKACELSVMRGHADEALDDLDQY